MAMIQTFPTGSGSGSGGSITILGCFNTAPATFVQGDIYYNTTDNLIYTANSSTTWDAGSTPKKDILYISLDDHKIYSYANSVFEVYGGDSVSSKTNNAIKNITGSSTPSENGIYVEDLNAKIDKLNYSQKIVNKPGREELISAPISLPKFTKPTTGGTSVMTNLGVTITLNNDINNYEYIDISLQPSSTARKRIPQIIRFRVDDIVYNNTTSENAIDGSIILLHYDVDTTSGYGGQYHMNIKAWFKDNINLYLFQGSTSIADENWRDWVITNITGVITESTIINPVEYVDSTKGIEDTPVGELIRTLGDETPKHYLACDGSIYNIADYPHLAQYFKDTFGAINVFGGDGITTFAVPDYAIEKKLNTSSIASNAWASSIYNSNYAASKAFNGTVNVNINYWQTAEPVTFPVEIGIDLGSEYYITRYALHNYGWNTASINDRPNAWDFEGSNDKTNWNTIDTVKNYIWTSNTPEFKVSIPGSYRYYRLIIKTCVGTGVSGVSIAPILNQILLYYANSNFTHIKAEPTYYMELNQAAYVNQYCDYYDTNERIVGKWTDGKPVYRKVVPVTLPSGTGGTNTAHGISNMDTLVNYSLTWYDTLDGAWYDRFRLWEGSYGIAMEMNINGTNINIGSNKTNTINWTSRTSKAYATLEYTKTTDAPNSFDYGMIIDQFAQEALLDVAVTDAEVNRCFE